MLAELTAIKTALSALVPAGIGDMSGHLPPFASVWAGPGNRPEDESAGGPDGDEFSGRVGVTFTAARTDAALKLAAAGIAALTPNRCPALLAVAGRTAWLEFAGAELARIDTAVTLPDSNTHPAYVVAHFDVHSIPAAEEAP